MPVPVLERHGVVVRDGDIVRLTAGALPIRERARVRAACEHRIQEFVGRRGLSVWDYTLSEVAPVPERTRYSVLVRAGGRCSLCHTAERPLQVDHIVPRSRGGTNDEDNLQALCDVCNRGKSNRDATDFRELDGIATDS
ncbi:MAG: HNH endonuclease [Actinobacteria bacterium]|nr:HNH endonuclease [Actinomycetota bacterium]